MEIILKENVDKLGAAGEIVKVKDGYARNFLIPKGLAAPATEASKRIIEEEKRQLEVRNRKMKKTMEEMAEKMKDISCTLVRQTVEEEDRLYGSVTAHDIAEAITGQGQFEIDHKQVVLEEPIKSLGVYTVTIDLDREVQVPVKVWVVKE